MRRPSTLTASVKQDRRGVSSTKTVQAAFTAITTGFRSGQANDFPQIVQQQQIIGHRIDAAAAVENELKNAGHACRSNTTFGTPFK
jgi:hypothetical protein